MNIKPMYDRVLAKRLETKEEMVGGIIKKSLIKAHAERKP